MAWFLLTVCTVTPALAYAAVVALLPGGERPLRERLARRRREGRQGATRQGEGRQDAGRHGADRQDAGRQGAGRHGAGRQDAGRQDAGRHGAGRRGLLHRPLPDPFDALQVQTRLAIVAEHIRHLEEDRHAWARAERIIAAQLAYDALLAQACRMAGVEVLPRAKGDPWERLREEVELIARGWTW
jgi:hypothetical protein